LAGPVPGVVWSAVVSNAVDVTDRSGAVDSLVDAAADSVVDEVTARPVAAVVATVPGAWGIATDVDARGNAAADPAAGIVGDAAAPALT